MESRSVFQAETQANCFFYWIASLAPPELVAVDAAPEVPLPGRELDVEERGDVGVVLDDVVRVVLADEGRQAEPHQQVVHHRQRGDAHVDLGGDATQIKFHVI